jgi:hypothetical protein
MGLTLAAFTDTLQGHCISAFSSVEFNYPSSYRDWFFDPVTIGYGVHDCIIGTLEPMHNRRRVGAPSCSGSTLGAA